TLGPWALPHNEPRKTRNHESHEQEWIELRPRIRARGVRIARSEWRHDARRRFESVAPHAGGVVGEQMNRDGQRVGDRGHEMDVVGGRQERVELTATQLLALRDLQARAPRIAAVV